MANVVELGARTSIRRQARKWLIRMDGDEPLTDTERKALRRWMSRSAAHRGELVCLARLWNQANILTELITGVEAQRRERGKQRAASWIGKIVMTGSTVLASVVILLYCGLQSPVGTVPRTYETVTGQQKTIVLPDGSAVTLNTASRVEVTYSNTARRIRLTKGEALFSVTPDPDKVFEVDVAASTVRAVGTAFAVHLEGRRVDVTVAKGIVDVADSASTRLRAGEVVSFDSGGGRMELHELTSAELQRRMAWQDGFLAFSGQPLSEVVMQLNRYSTTTLTIGDPKLASLAIGGRFRTGDVDAVLDLLNTTFGVRARQVNERTIRLESD